MSRKGPKIARNALGLIMVSFDGWLIFYSHWGNHKHVCRMNSIRSVSYVCFPEFKGQWMKK